MNFARIRGCAFGVAVALLGVPSAAFSQDDSKPRFIGLILVSHGQLASEMRRTAEHIVGEQVLMRTIDVEENDDMEARRQDILQAIEEVDAGCGVLILTDMFGGTPSNLAISTMIQGKVEVVAGMNLPMVVKSIAMRATCDLELTMLSASAAGRRYINAASSLLRKQQPEEPDSPPVGE
ncbi:MAG: PTS sugar transporter subunit IIA [Hyphomonadaceae bacterium]